MLSSLSQSGNVSSLWRTMIEHGRWQDLRWPDEIDSRRSVRARSEGLGLRCRLRFGRSIDRETPDRESSSPAFREPRPTFNRGLILVDLSQTEINSPSNNRSASKTIPRTRAC